MAKVAPESGLSESTEANAGIGPGRGNGCCCACLGGDPGPIPTEEITKAGGKFIRVENDRIIEYFVYGSTKHDAKVLLQFGGNFSTGYWFAGCKALTAKLEELNVKGISISLPGVGYSSMNYGANLYNFAKNDVAKVLEAEKVEEFMVEGTSNGSMVAMGTAHAHTNKVESMYLNVPFISLGVAKEVTPHVLPTDSYLPCQAKCISSAGLRGCCPGCCTFCCLSCCFNGAFACMGECDAHADDRREIPELGKLQLEDTKRAFRHNRAGFCLSQVFTGIAPGFDLREIAARLKGKDRVLVSFAVNDQSAAPDHARYLIELFDAAYQVGDGNALKPKMADGHGFWIWRLMKGLMTEQQLKLSAPEQQAMDGNAYHQVPKPEGFSLEITPKKK